MQKISSKYILILRLIFLIAFFLLYSSYLISSIDRYSSKSVVYFSSALRKAAVTGTVRVGGNSYEVRNNLVNDGNISESKRSSILRTAYAKVLLERAPLFSITGINLSRFRYNLKKIVENRSILSGIQDTYIQKFLVYYALYPSDYLNTLAGTEESRIHFIESRDTKDMVAYTRSLERVYSTYITSSLIFESSFKYLVPSTTNTYLNEIHKINRVNSVTTLRLLRARISSTYTILLKRNLCIAGDISDCKESALLIPNVILSGKVNLSEPEKENVVTTRHHNKSPDIKDRLIDPSAKSALPLVSVIIEKSACTDKRVPPVFGTFRRGNSQRVESTSSARFLNIEGVSMETLVNELGVYFDYHRPYNKLCHEDN